MSVNPKSFGESSIGRHACAACRHQRKRCEEDCVMAPYFTADKEDEFKAVHKVFGVSNMTKLLKPLKDANHRALAVESFIWEANMWKEDPISGPRGKYIALEQQYEYLKNVLKSLNGPPELKSAGVVDQRSTKVVGGAVPINGRGMSYGNYGNNEILGFDQGYNNNPSFTSLLHGQDNESNKAIVDSFNVGSNYVTPNSQVSGYQNQRGIGMESSYNNFHHQYPMLQGSDNVENYRPTQAQGRGIGSGNGIVAYDHHNGQAQKREIGAMGSQVGPIPSDNRRNMTQRYLPYEQPNRVHQMPPRQATRQQDQNQLQNHAPQHQGLPRQAMKQRDQNQQNYAAQHQWNSTNSQRCDNFQDNAHNNEVKIEKKP